MLFFNLLIVYCGPWWNGGGSGFVVSIVGSVVIVSVSSVELFAAVDAPNTNCVYEK